MFGSNWSASEKKIARRVFDTALARELAEVMREFKERASAARTPKEMWAVEKFLAAARWQIDSTYDYRYSQLERVFGRLLREDQITDKDLEGLSEDKLGTIRSIATLGGGSGTLPKRENSPEG